MKSYLITGASSGMGEQMARLAVARGDRVFGVARRQERLAALAAELGDRFVPLICDVSDKAAVQKICAELPELPDIVILNAGNGDLESRHSFDLALHERVFAVNYFGALYFIDALFPRLVERGHGTFVGIASMAAYRGLPKAAAYCASKAALSVGLEAMRVTYGKLGLNFITVHPGFVDTPMAKGASRPFQWTAAKAAATIMRGIDRGCIDIVFPWPMRMLMSFARVLPPGIYRRVIS